VLLDANPSAEIVEAAQVEPPAESIPAVPSSPPQDGEFPGISENERAKAIARHCEEHHIDLAAYLTEHAADPAAKTPNIVDLEAARVARLDCERNERDRKLGRGYDYAHLQQSTSSQTAIDPSVQAELARNWPLAQRLGWTYERIWNSCFWPHSTKQPRGLAAVLQPSDTIVEVTGQWITLLVERRHTQRFPKSES
jgi:hypothetical protein